MAVRIGKVGRSQVSVLFATLLLCNVLSCGLPLRFTIHEFKRQHPDMVASVVVSGLADLVPAEELGSCGPNNELAEIIPDCPLPGICFTAACALHDLCYSTCGADQSACDMGFFWDMVHFCEAGTSDFFVRNRCYSIAWIYYRAVRDYGEDFFWNTQVIVCARAGTPLGSDAAIDNTPADPLDPSTEAAEYPIPPPFVDADNDLMPDDWEIEMHLDPTDPYDARLDYDQDGRANLTEYIQGTDPYVPALDSW